MLKHLYRAGDAVEIDPGVKRDRGTVQTLIGLQLTITETKLLPNRFHPACAEQHPASTLRRGAFSTLETASHRRVAVQAPAHLLSQAVSWQSSQCLYPLFSTRDWHY